MLGRNKMSKTLGTILLPVVFIFCIGLVDGMCDLMKLPLKTTKKSVSAAPKADPHDNLMNNKKNLPYVLMVTSLDDGISSTPLLDILPQTIKILNDSPFNGIALTLMDPYSGQPIPSKEKVAKKAQNIKAISKKDIWARVDINRIIQRCKGDPYYEKGWTKEELAKLSTTGLPFGKVRKMSTVYFDKIKGWDIFDDEGALSDFYKLWTLSLKFAKTMNSGIVLDLENYHNHNHAERYSVSFIADKQNRSVEEIITKLEQIGVHLTDIAAEEYPHVTILNLFSFYRQSTYQKGQLLIPAYISYGMLMRAKERGIALRFVEGGEADIGYINTSLYSLRKKINQRGSNYRDWLELFPNNFYLAGTITIWNDPSKISGWVKQDARGDLYFRSLVDFRPYLSELARNYDFIWFYVPSVIDYKPFDPMGAREFNKKLDILIKEQKIN